MCAKGSPRLGDFDSTLAMTRHCGTLNDPQITIQSQCRNSKDNISLHCRLIYLFNMSTCPSSTDFGDKMGVGWKDGLRHKFSANVRVHLNYDIEDVSGDRLGDVDAIIHSTSPLSVYHDLFPTSCLSIRPPKESLTAASSSNCYVAEIKRSMNSGFDSKIDTFVRFYGGLFSDSLEFTKRDLTTVRTTTTKLLGKPLRKAVSNPNTNILFVFNGQDLAAVQTRMRQSIRDHLGNEDMKIHGHRVICVWCDSAELIKWKDMMQKQEMDLQMQEMARQMQEQKRKQRQEKDRLMHLVQEKDRQIQRLLEEGADPGRITGEKRKRNGP